MKEADIVFGERYAVDTGNSKTCYIVVDKVPVQPGKTRSRTYNCRQPDSQNQWVTQVDASKIVMRWSEYEKTEEYFQAHSEDVNRQLMSSMAAAQRTWVETLGEYVQAILPGTDSERVARVYMAGTMPHREPDDFIQWALRRSTVTISVEQFLQMSGNEYILPPDDEIRSVQELRHDVEKEHAAHLLPKKEEEIREIMTTQGGVGEYAIRDYVALLTTLDIPGPHPLLLEMVQQAPAASIWRELTADPRFGYLIAHLSL